MEKHEKLFFNFEFGSFVCFPEKLKSTSRKLERSLANDTDTGIGIVASPFSYWQQWEGLSQTLALRRGRC